MGFALQCSPLLLIARTSPADPRQGQDVPANGPDQPGERRRSRSSFARP